MRTLIFLSVLINIGCSKVYEIADQIVDSIYFDQRIEQYCTDAIFESYSLLKQQKLGQTPQMIYFAHLKPKPY